MALSAMHVGMHMHVHTCRIGRGRPRGSWCGDSGPMGPRSLQVAAVSAATNQELLCTPGAHPRLSLGAMHPRSDEVEVEATTYWSTFKGTGVSGVQAVGGVADGHTGANMWGHMLSLFVFLRITLRTARAPVLTAAERAHVSVLSVACCVSVCCVCR